MKRACERCGAFFEGPDLRCDRCRLLEQVDSRDRRFRRRRAVAWGALVAAVALWSAVLVRPAIAALGVVPMALASYGHAASRRRALTKDQHRHLELAHRVAFILGGAEIVAGVLLWLLRGH